MRGSRMFRELLFKGVQEGGKDPVRVVDGLPGYRPAGLFLQIRLFIAGELDELDARPVAAVYLPAPHQHAAFISADALFEPDETRGELMLRFDADADDADIDELRMVVVPRELLKGDDPE